MRRIVALADDLSGAAESGAVLGSCTRIALHRAGVYRYETSSRLVVDMDTRHSDPAVALRAFRAAIESSASDGVVLVCKVDSRLRGNVAAQVAAAVEGGWRVVMASALPALGRPIRNGVAHIAEPSEAQRPLRPSVDVAVADVLRSPSVVIGLDAVRAGCDALRTTLHEIPDSTVALCDAETDSDLDLIAMAVSGDDDTILFGSSGLVSAVGRTLPLAEGEDPLAIRTEGSRPLVFVVGTAEVHAHEQLRQLAGAGVPVLRMAQGGHELSDATRLREALRQSVVAVAVDEETDAHAVPRGILEALIDFVEPAIGDADLMLTGGETARAVLDRIGVSSLVVDGMGEYGTVFCRLSDGRRVVTRPGSFGTAKNLRNVLHALRPGWAARLEGASRQ